MGEPKANGISSSASLNPVTSLVEPSNKRKHKNGKVVRAFRSVVRSFPIIAPSCKFPSIPGGILPDSHRSTTEKITGTIFGYRKGKVSFSMQENPKTLPALVVELALQTNVLQKEMSLGMVRIALECEKRPDKDKTKIVEEPVWTMFCNGKKTGYGVKREPTEEDLNLMEILRAISMGAGVLPGKAEGEGPDGEMTYMRAHFERASTKDSETLYMLSPGMSEGFELSIFFVRV